MIANYRRVLKASVKRRNIFKHIYRQRVRVRHGRGFIKDKRSR